MFYKKVLLFLVLMLSFSFISITAFAQPNEEEQFEIWPLFIDPPDGSVDIIVPQGENVVIKTRWGACSRGLSRAWTRKNVVTFSIDGEPVVSSRRESRRHWSRPESVYIGDEYPCVNGTDTGWFVYWEYDLGVLDEGSYLVHYEENVKRPFTDGTDYDGNGRPDKINWHISVDFNIVVTNNGSISGRVVDESGNPISGIWVDTCEESVSLEMWGSSILCNSAETDENGDYTIPNLTPGNYRLVIWSDPFYVVEFYEDASTYENAGLVSVTGGQTTSAIDFVLADAGNISGRVVDELGDPISGIWVDSCEESVSLEIWGSSILCNGAETNENGDYTIPNLTPGNYRLVIWSDPFYVIEFYDDAATYEDASLLSVTGGQTTSDIDFALAELGD